MTLLPNGWRIAPAGRHISVGDLPLAMVESPDGRYLIVSNNGYAKPTLSVVDVARLYVKSRVPLDNAWLGLAWHPDGKRLFSSGAGGEQRARAALDAQRRADRRSERRPQAPEQGELRGRRRGEPGRVDACSPCTPWVSCCPRSRWAARSRRPTVTSVDLRRGGLHGARLARRRDRLRLPLGRRAASSLFDPATLEPRGRDRGRRAPERDGPLQGRHAAVRGLREHERGLGRRPRHADGARADLGRALPRRAPRAARPTVSASRRTARTLLVASADNNAVAVVDVSRPGASVVKGFIPTGWYPTAVQFSGDGRHIYVLSGKGLTSQANPRGPQPGVFGERGPIRGIDAAGLALGGAGSRRRAARRLHEEGARADALHGRRASGSAESSGRTRPSRARSATPRPSNTSST